MPIHDYKCPKCGNEFSQLHKTFSSVSEFIPICNNCGTIAERMETYGTSFVLKGKDWPGKEIKGEIINKE